IAVATRVTRLPAPIVPSTLYLPSMVNATRLVPSVPAVSVAFPDAAAPFRKPCGVSQISNCRSSAAAGCGAGPLAPTFPAVRAAVPRLVADHLGVLLLTAEHGLRERHLFLRRAAVVVDRPRVSGEVAARPFLAGRERLTEEGVHAGAGVLDRLRVAHRLLRVRDHTGGVFRARAADGQENDDDREQAVRLLHPADATPTGAPIHQRMPLASMTPAFRWPYGLSSGWLSERAPAFKACA